MKIVGDKLYGQRAKLLEELEKVGYEPVCIAGGTIRKGVKADARRRVDERAKRYKDILKGRYRIEQVFGVIKEICGNYLSVKSEKVARLMVLCMFVLWNMGRLQDLIGGYIFTFLTRLVFYLGIFDTASFCLDTS